MKLSRSFFQKKRGTSAASNDDDCLISILRAGYISHFDVFLTYTERRTQKRVLFFWMASNYYITPRQWRNAFVTPKEIHKNLEKDNIFSLKRWLKPNRFYRFLSLFVWGWTSLATWEKRSPQQIKNSKNHRKLDLCTLNYELFKRHLSPSKKRSFPFFSKIFPSPPFIKASQKVALSPPTTKTHRVFCVCYRAGAFRFLTRLHTFRRQPRWIATHISGEREREREDGYGYISSQYWIFAEGLRLLLFSLEWRKKIKNGGNMWREVNLFQFLFSLSFFWFGKRRRRISDPWAIESPASHAYIEGASFKGSLLLLLGVLPWKKKASPPLWTFFCTNSGVPKDFAGQVQTRAEPAQTTCDLRNNVGF